MSANTPVDHVSRKLFLEDMDTRLGLIAGGTEFLSLNLFATDLRLRDAMAGRIAVDPPLEKAHINRFTMMINAIAEEQKNLKQTSEKIQIQPVAGA